MAGKTRLIGNGCLADRLPEAFVYQSFRENFSWNGVLGCALLFVIAARSRNRFLALFVRRARFGLPCRTYFAGGCWAACAGEDRQSRNGNVSDSKRKEEKACPL
jgi:hypothetical protein